MGLGNLTAVIDCNGMQAKGACREIMQLEPLAEKWSAFRWNIMETDGHDCTAVIRSLGSVRERGRATGRPTVLIAHTVKGKGISFMENVTRWHNAPPTDEELSAALRELSCSDSTLSEAKQLS
jgi:transketolase